MPHTTVPSHHCLQHELDRLLGPWWCTEISAMKTSRLYVAVIVTFLIFALWSVFLANRSLQGASPLTLAKERYLFDTKQRTVILGTAIGHSPLESGKTIEARSNIKHSTSDSTKLFSLESARKLYSQKLAGAPAIPIGILSEQPEIFFRALQDEIDTSDPSERCRRYRGTYSAPEKNRRIFYGALAASEPWELLEIVAAETYGVFEAMVWVESNRTQNFTPRPFLRLCQEDTLRRLFGVEKVAIVAHVNEVSSSELDNAVASRIGGNASVDRIFLAREHLQRNEIVRVWKKQGMTGDDVGLLVDMDETLTRDFLRAVQHCDGIPALDYAKHHCDHRVVKLVSVAKTFETSPECITADRRGFHPEMIIGACIEGIGDSDVHPSAPRENGTFLRKPGYGGNCDWSQVRRFSKNGKYPLWDMSDFRRTCGGASLPLDTKAFPQYDMYTAYHFHNFFADFNATRFKMKTYGHPKADALTRGLEHLSNDLTLMYRCAKDLKDTSKQKWKRVRGGFAAAKSFMPIYFQDEEYRRRRHSYVQKMVELDDQYTQKIP